MDIKELKIGYYIDSGGQMAKIISIDPENNTVEIVNEDNKVEVLHLQDASISPVPLTLAILMRCGFNERGILYFDINGHVFSFKFKEDHIILCDKVTHPLVHFWEVRYLHLVQRLYYGLTGKKLTLSLIKPQSN